MKKVIVAITGASGVVVGVTLIKHLSRIKDVDIHIVTSDAAQIVSDAEDDHDLSYWIRKTIHASKFITHYDSKNIAAPIASGSFQTAGMVIVPCTINTMSKIAHCMTGDLITRAADVCMKERRKLIIGVRETPFHTLHLKMLTTLSEMGAVICPFIPSFYSKPKTIEDLIDQYCGRIIDQLGIENDLAHRWGS